MKIDQKIQNFKTLDFKKPFDVIFGEVSQFMAGYKCISFPWYHNYVYRARKKEKKIKNGDVLFKNIEDLWCRKCKNISDFGRLHWPKYSVFYSSGSLKTAILETKPECGDLVTVMRCRRKERIKTIAFGFPDNAVFIDGTGKKIKWQNYKKKKLRDLLQYNRIDRFLNEVYRDKDDGINSQGNDKYKVTAAIAKMYFDNPVNGSNKLECICYPSVSGLAGATNYAFPKKIADKVLEPDSFYVFEICSGGKYGNFALKIVCFSLNYTNNGKIEWENIILR